MKISFILLLLLVTLTHQYDQESFDACDNFRNSSASLDTYSKIHIKSGYKCCFSEGFYKGFQSDICVPLSPDQYNNIDKYIKETEDANKADNLDITKVTCQDIDQVNYDKCDELTSSATLDKCQSIKISGYKCCLLKAKVNGQNVEKCEPLTNGESKNIDIYMEEKEKSQKSNYNEFDVLSVECNNNGSSMLYLVSSLLILLNMFYF